MSPLNDFSEETSEESEDDEPCPDPLPPQFGDDDPGNDLSTFHDTRIEAYDDSDDDSSDSQLEAVMVTENEIPTEEDPPAVTTMDSSTPLAAPTADSVDTSLFDRYEAYQEKKNKGGERNILNTPEYRAALDLLKLLQKMNIQLYAFYARFAWAHQSAKTGHDFNEKPT